MSPKTDFTWLVELRHVAIDHDQKNHPMTCAVEILFRTVLHVDITVVPRKASEPYDPMHQALTKLSVRKSGERISPQAGSMEREHRQKPHLLVLKTSYPMHPFGRL